MTQEDKELLLKDLCARLPYKVKVLMDFERQFDGGSICTLTSIKLEETPIFNVDVTLHDCNIEELRPFLRSMSSMTEEEMEELKALCSIYIPTDSPTIGFEDYGILVFTHHLTNNTYSFKLNFSVINWLNKNHFDYRGLIEKGLAIVITEENNPYKE